MTLLKLFADLLDKGYDVALKKTSEHTYRIYIYDTYEREVFNYMFLEKDTDAGVASDLCDMLEQEKIL